MLSLVVDDDPYIRAYIKMILEREGFETVEAEGGNSALQIVEMLCGCVDLIVTDIQMPNGDGLTFANAARKTFRPVPTILVSGRPKPDTAFEFIEKLFASAALARMVRKLVAPTAKTA